MENTISIVLIGSGNVATRLAMEFHEIKKVNIAAVYSRSNESVRYLAQHLEVPIIHELESLPEADMYIISVSDNAISKVAQNMKIKRGVVVHTSGTTDINILKQFEEYGVFYPLQTFKKNRSVNFKDIPICLEANNMAAEKKLLQLASLLSTKTFLVNSAQRKSLHVSAVFACNFTNFMYKAAQDILEKENVPFSILEPLIQETAAKITQLKPSEAQTGPALRNDSSTIKLHQEYLSNFPEYKKIYNFITENIQKHWNNKSNGKL